MANGESIELGSKEKVASRKSSLPHSMKTMKLKLAFVVFKANTYVSVGQGLEWDKNFP